MATATSRSALEAGLALARRDVMTYVNLMIAGVDGDSVHGHPFQTLLYDSLACCLRAGKHCVLVMPPEHIKTTAVGRWAIWQKALNPRLRIGLTSGDEGRAKKTLTAIRKIILSDLNRAVFPAMRPDQVRSQARGEWNQTRLYLDGDTTDPSFEVYPFEGEAGGARLDILIMDDVIGVSCKTSEADRLRTYGIIHGQWLNRLTGGGIGVILNNVWHREDAIHKMALSQSFHTLWMGYEGTEQIYWKCHAPAAGWEHGEGGKLPLWEEVWPQPRLEARYEADPFSYKQMFGGRAMLAEECIFPNHELWKRYYPEDLVRAGPAMRIYAHLDPAGGKYVKHGDFAAVSVVAIDENRIMYLLACWCWRADALEQARMLWDLNEQMKREYNKPIFRATVEMLPKDEGWIVPLIHAINAEEQKRGNSLDVLSRYSQAPKPTRIHSILKHIRHGFIRFPWDWEERIARDANVRNFTNQLEDYPLGEHDDGPDALEGVISLAEAEGPEPLLKPDQAEDQWINAIQAAAREQAATNRIGKRAMDGSWKPPKVNRLRMR